MSLSAQGYDRTVWTQIYQCAHWYKVHNWWRGRCNSDAFLFGWLHYNPDHHSTTVLQTPCTLCLLILRNNMEKQWDCKYCEREKDLQQWMPCPQWPHIGAEHLMIFFSMMLLHHITWKPTWEKVQNQAILAWSEGAMAGSHWDTGTNPGLVPLFKQQINWQMHLTEDVDDIPYRHGQPKRSCFEPVNYSHVLHFK